MIHNQFILQKYKKMNWIWDFFVILQRFMLNGVLLFEIFFLKLYNLLYCKKIWNN